MYIEINDSKTIREIQEEFNGHFPFLKLEFYTAGHIWTELSSASHRIEPRKKLGEIRKIHVPGLLEIFPDQKTGTVEQHLSRRFDLNAQVYRLHGDTWIQTAGTDELTLQEQNEIGRKNSDPSLHPDLFETVGETDW